MRLPSVGASLTQVGNEPKPAPLLAAMAETLRPDLRASWTPGEGWVGWHTKAQLLVITHELTGHEPPASLAAKKKPELVAHVVAILAEGARQGFDDAGLNARVNVAAGLWSILVYGVRRRLAPRGW